MQNDNNENSLLAQLSGAAKQHSRRRGITIYLAGKISKNDWRHRLVPELRDSPRNENGPVTESPILENGIAPGLHYSGPHFVGCDHGCFHGKGTHGAIDNGKNCGSGTPAAVPYKDRHLVSFGCLWQIKRSRIVFAWIKSPDAYGTLTEIGVAVALGKTVWFGGPERFPDLWFAESLADVVSYGYSDPAEFMAACLSEKLGAPYTAENGRLCLSQGNAVFRN